METEPAPTPRRYLRDRHVHLILIVLGMATRLPFMRAFDLVTFDGTYYITTARALMQGSLHGVSFPVGYPLLVGLFLPLIGDGVRAAQAVSFISGIGSLLVLYALARHFVGRKSALLCSVLLALNPLAIRYSMLSMSESLYIFMVLLGLWLFSKKTWARTALAGLAMGYAAITRPEAVPIVAALAVVTFKRPRRLLTLLAGFVLLSSVNSVILSKATGRVVVLPKVEALRSVAVNWTEREAVAEGVSRETVEREASEGAAAHNPVAKYLRRLPDELALLHRHILAAVFALALAAMVYRPGFLLAALVPFFIFPAFTDRSDARWILPYVPVMILYGVIGAGLFRHRFLRGAGYALLIITSGAGAWWNRAQLLEPVGATYAATREAAEFFKDKVAAGDKIADRKPYFAFYTGGEYVEIPMAPYEDTMRHLTEERIQLLSLHLATTHNFRPALAPLLHDAALIAGEVRWRQVYAAPTGEVIYERIRDADPLTWRQVSRLPGSVHVPAWSPDGRLIAFRNTDENGVGGIYTVTAEGAALRLVAEVGARQDEIAWSGDGRSIAFAASQMGNLDIYSVDIASGQITEVVSDAGNDFSPAWSRAAEELVFCSNRSGAVEIWIKDLRTGRQFRVTRDGGNTHPAPAPRGNRIAWVDGDRRLVVLDRNTNRRTRVEVPKDVVSAPAWSPDGRFLAVAARHWRATDIYLVKADGSGALLLTRDMKPDGMPCWSPTASRLAIVSESGGHEAVWVLDGLQDYLDRLRKPIPIHTFPPPAGN
ncbi:MAG: glycosyltransferase family 39 protein [Candidatus Krumholzibacteriia bacterium]